jgi:hypothetical protein
MVIARRELVIKVAEGTLYIEQSMIERESGQIFGNDERLYSRVNMSGMQYPPSLDHVCCEF